MFPEPSLPEVAQYVVLNIASAMLCAASHNALYFMLGLTNWAFHFCHYFFTFLTLFMSYCCGMIPKQSIPLREVLPLALTQFGVSVCTGMIHHGGRDGALYTMRLSDGAVTILILYFGKRFVDPAYLPGDHKKPLLIFTAVSASVAWLEFGILDKDFTALALTPVLAVFTALHFILVFQKQQKLQCHTDMLMLHVTGMTSAMLAVPAIAITSDGFNKEMLGTATAWETIDYALMAMSLVFFIGLIYSKYWLLCNLSPESYLIARHTKYTLAAYGQWFTQNMAHVTIWSAIGKMGATVGLGYYGWRRWAENRSANKYTTVNGVAKVFT